MAALGPGEGGFYPLSEPNWGGGPAWESELYQGSPLPQLGCPCLSMSRCGLNGSHMLASWAVERGSDVCFCCHSRDFGRVLILLDWHSRRSCRKSRRWLGLEEAVRKLGRKDSLPWGYLILQGRCLSGAQVQVPVPACHRHHPLGTSI